jgi:voltage-gated potassium channel
MVTVPPTAGRGARVRAALTIRVRLLAAVGVLLFLVCPFTVWLSEKSRNPNIRTLGSGYQWLGRTLFETSSAYKLYTGLGFVVYYTVRVAGVSLIAFGTGTIASRLVSTVLQRGKGMGSTKASDHVLICGWSSKGPEIVREIRAKDAGKDRRIVVLSRHTDDPTKDDSVEFLHGDPSDADDLHRAGLLKCATAIILADESDPGATAGDKDARTLLTCLAVESIHPEVYSCVEVVRSENRQHFAQAKVDEMVVSAELTGALLGASARTHGLSKVVTDLVTTQTGGQEFYRMKVPPDLVGSTVAAAIGSIKAEFDALLVGLAGVSGFDLNPAASRVLAADDVVLVISADAATLHPHGLS